MKADYKVSLVKISDISRATRRVQRGRGNPTRPPWQRSALMSRAGSISTATSKAPLRRQVWRRCRALGLGTLEAYLAVLQADAGELVQLQHGLLVSVSAFFREAAMHRVI